MANRFVDKLLLTAFMVAGFSLAHCILLMLKNQRIGIVDQKEGVVKGCGGGLGIAISSVDAQGRMVGVNTVMARPEVGMAAPVPVIKEFLKERLGMDGRARI